MQQVRRLASLLALWAHHRVPTWISSDTTPAEMTKRVHVYKKNKRLRNEFFTLKPMVYAHTKDNVDLSSSAGMPTKFKLDTTDP